MGDLSVNSKSYTRTYSSAKTEESNMIFFDPTLVKAARNIYRNYCNLNIQPNSRPMGVVINRDNHRGQLSFHSKPILLPRECFIPLKQIETEVY